jgi:cyclic-di-GMP-binding protein
MADNFSFDVVSEINLQELDNAVVQAQKEIGTRFDFKGTSAGIGELNKKDKNITLTAENDAQLESVRSVLVQKMTKRGVDPRVLDPQKLEQATHKTVRQLFKLKSGIDRDTAKTLVQKIKDLKLKVQPSIQGETLRVTSPKKDDLQAVMTALRGADTPLPLQFQNFR